ESLGQYASAETSHRKASSLRKEVLGRKHPHTLTSMSNLARVLESQGNYEESLRLYQRESTGYDTVLGNDHPITLTCH
ncbi:hypothetical protein COCVIDRAFT_43414, partial [Bipolaris victoriae FI3]